MLCLRLLAGNDDCHLKNLSFYVGPDGIALAPHYDLLSTGAYYTRWPTVPMAFALPDATVFGQVTLASMLKAAAVLGVPERVARRVISSMVTNLPAAFKALVAEFEASRAQLPQDANVFLGAQAHLARVLENMTFRDMIERLRE